MPRDLGLCLQDSIAQRAFAHLGGEMVCVLPVTASSTPSTHDFARPLPTLRGALIFSVQGAMRRKRVVSDARKLATDHSTILTVVALGCVAFIADRAGSPIIAAMLAAAGWCCSQWVFDHGGDRAEHRLPRPGCRVICSHEGLICAPA